METQEKLWSIGNRDEKGRGEWEGYILENDI